MQKREAYQKHELGFLAPYAVHSLHSHGREYAEDECPFRTPFQRDRDRIIHAEAFRRLEYKTQVFVNHEGDYYRTRLTHTLEVAQISRGMSRTLKLNEDLTEAIALAHDLGHTPFGHRGEEVMNRLMKDYGGFEHNRQSYRVVTELERRYPHFNGLNLTFEVREGIAKHRGEYDNPHIPEFPAKGYPSLETQVVDISDQIAYMNHDLDDGLQSGMLTYEQLEQVPLWQEMWEQTRRDFPDARQKIWKYQTIRRLIHLLVSDILEETYKQIEAKKIRSLADVRERGKRLAHFSPHLEEKTKTMMSFLFKHLYQHPRVEAMATEAETILTDLFHHYIHRPEVLPTTLANLIATSDRKEHLICDYMAGMTDRFAHNEYARLIQSE